MGWSERGKREMQGMLLPVIVCMCFIASSLLFLVQMIVKSEEENITDLYNAANQTSSWRFWRMSTIRMPLSAWDTRMPPDRGKWLIWLEILRRYPSQRQHFFKGRWRGKRVYP